ncbi:MAG: hypothetical protein ABIG67_01880 [Pseudomonadota bacterium]
MPEGSVHAKLLLSVDFETKAEPYLIEIPPERNLPSQWINPGPGLARLLWLKIK